MKWDWKLCGWGRGKVSLSLSLPPPILKVQEFSFTSLIKDTSFVEFQWLTFCFPKICIHLAQYCEKTKLKWTLWNGSCVITLQTCSSVIQQTGGGSLRTKMLYCWLRNLWPANLKQLVPRPALSCSQREASLQWAMVSCASMWLLATGCRFLGKNAFHVHKSTTPQCTLQKKCWKRIGGKL